MKRNALTIPTTLLAFSLVGSLACNEKDPAQCREALDQIRIALEKGDIAKAKEERAAGYKHCKPNVMGSVDRDIVTKQDEVATREAAGEIKAQETKRLLELLVQQIAANRGAATAPEAPNAPNAPDAAGSTDADGDKSPPACNGAAGDASEGTQPLCTTKRKVQGKPYAIEFAFLRENPAAFRYRTEPTGEFDCAALGEHAVKREWTHKRRERKHCGFTGGALDGLEAVTSVGPGEYWVEVFSTEFVEATPELKDQLEKEGT